MTKWSLAQVERAAPDAAALAAARKLATPGPWSETGSSPTLLWGRCQGSGRTPYQVSIDLAGPAYRCSCPSRKFPCKHALALMVLWARGDAASGGEPGAEAKAWAEQRAEKAAGQTVRAARKTPDPVAQAKRLADRLALMDAGVEDFALWLGDLVRSGTIAARRQPRAWWEAAAARLVDAQLPGLAERVRDVAGEVQRREDWADHLLAELGRWWLVVSAWRRREDLDEATAADLRQEVGWTVPTEEVRAGDELPDQWQVLGAHRSDAGRLQQQRTWLRGRRTGEDVVVLDFAARAEPLPTARMVGSVLDVPLARYPGAAPRRALFTVEAIIAEPAARLPAGVDLDTALLGLAEAWATNPWVVRVPVVLAAVSLGSDGRLHDPHGRVLPLLDHDGLTTLVALTGGRPVDVFGELEAGGFRALTVDLDEHGEAR